MDNGFRVLPEGVRGAARLVTERGTRRAKEYWGEQLFKLREGADASMPVLLAIRKELKVDQHGARASLHSKSEISEIELKSLHYLKNEKKYEKGSSKKW